MTIATSDVILWLERVSNNLVDKSSAYTEVSNTLTTDAGAPTNLTNGSMSMSNSAYFSSWGNAGDAGASGTSRTWSVWFYAATFGAGDYWSCGYLSSNTNMSWSLGQFSSKTTFAYYTPSIGDQINSGTTNYTNGAWNHLVVSLTYGTGSSIKMYLNGTDITNTTWTYGSGAAPGTNASRVHRVGKPKQTYLGNPAATIKFAQAIIFNRTLTSAEVTDLYNSGAGKTWDAYFSGGSTPTDDALFFGAGL